MRKRKNSQRKGTQRSQPDARTEQVGKSRHCPRAPPCSHYERIENKSKAQMPKKRMPTKQRRKEFGCEKPSMIIEGRGIRGEKGKKSQHRNEPTLSQFRRRHTHAADAALSQKVPMATHQERGA